MAKSDSKLIKAEKKWVKTELQEVCVCFTFRSEKKGRQCNMRRFFGPFSCHLLLRHSFLLQTVQCKATKWDNLWGFGYSSYFITAIIFVILDGKRSNICSYKESRPKSRYRTRAIISRGLYIFYPIFKDHFFVFKEVFSENFVFMYGLYSRAASNQERLMMARVRYLEFSLTSKTYT